VRLESSEGERPSREVQRPHKLLISDRQSVSIEGVADVRSFDDEEVILQTSAGTLLIRGSGLHIKSLNLETGNATIDGRLDAMEYEETKEKKRGWFVRLFR
jgi:sporulation protein YabP